MFIKKKKNLLFVILLIVSMISASLFAAYGVSQQEKDAADKAGKDAQAAAQEAEAKKKEAQEAGKKRAEAVANFEEAEKKLNEVQGQIEATQVEIQSIQASIEATKAEIAETEEDIKKKEAEINKQNEALGDRLTAMYKTGSAGLIDVVLSSESVEGLLANWGMVHRILESDQKLLEKLEQDHKELSIIKGKLEDQKEVLQNQEVSLEAQQLELESRQAETEELKKKYQEEADRLHAMQAEKEAEAAQMAAEAAARQAEAEAMIAEIERKEREEEEARKKKEQEKNQSGQSDTDTSSNTSSSGSHAWPLASNWIQTDNYGWRMCPFHGREFHNGLDLALTSGTNGAPVYAIDNGVVTKASWYGGYGNCVMYAIKGYTVLYGHLSGFNCSEGDVVKKGQVLGYVGSTGNSTGPHLHFTVFQNGDTINPYSLF